MNKTTTDPNRPLHVLLGILSILFVVLFLSLSWFNRLSTDDFYTLWLVKSKGITGSLAYLAHNWNLRVPAFLFSAIVVKYAQTTATLFIYGLVTLIALWFSNAYLLEKVFDLLFKFHPTRKRLLLYSMLLVISFFFLSFRIDDTWFWTASSVTYLWSWMFFLAGTGIILNKQRRPIEIILLLLGFGYIGSSDEAFALMLITACIAWLIYSASVSRSSHAELVSASVSLRKNRQLKVIYVLLISIVALIIHLYLPGEAVRQALFKPVSLLRTLEISAKAMAHLLLLTLPPKIPYMLLFSLPWLLIGKAANKTGGTDVSRFKQHFTISLLIYIFLLLATLLPMAAVMGDIAFNRTTSHLAFFLSLLLAYWCFITGYCIASAIKPIYWITYGALVAGIVFMLVQLFQQAGIASNYAQSFDARISQLQQLQQEGNKQAVGLKPLPASGLLHSAEITRDTLNDINVHFVKGLSLGYQVYVEGSRK